MLETLLDKGFFRLARSASKHSDYKVKVGCVIAIHGKPISVGFNVVKTHPLYNKGRVRKTIHAEIQAVIKAQCDLDGGVAYVYREHANSTPALARPCDLCYSVLEGAGLSKIFYTVGSYPFFNTERIR